MNGWKHLVRDGRLPTLRSLKNRPSVVACQVLFLDGLIQLPVQGATAAMRTSTAIAFKPDRKDTKETYEHCVSGAPPEQDDH
jgi:hypothetical protein